MPAATLLRSSLLSLLLLPCSAEAAAPSKRPKAAPKEARYYNGSWFHTFKGGQSWTEAKEKCESLGGQLAVIPDQATWDFVRGILPEGDFWLGATDLETEGTWKWVDGTTASFFAWRGGEPNSANGDEDYLSTPWADFPISTKYSKGYVCQWRGFEVLMALRFDVEDQNPEVHAALKTFREEMLTATRNPHAVAIKAADDAYLAALTKEAEAATKRRELELALAFTKEKELIQAGTAVPAEDKDTPPALAKLRQSHRAQCERADDERSRKAAPIARRCDLALQKAEAKVIQEGAAAQAMELKRLRASLVGLAM